MILDHTLGIFIHPLQEWHLIKSEKRSRIFEYLTHVPLTALIPAICGYYGVAHVGWSIGDGEKTYLTPNSAFALSLLMYFAFLVGTWIFAGFLDWMSTTYSDSGKENWHGMSIAVYVTTPLFLSGVFALYPQIWLVMTATIIAASYCVFLIYTGVPIMMDIPAERAFFYSSAIMTVAAVMVVTLMGSTVVIWLTGLEPVFVR